MDIKFEQRKKQLLNELSLKIAIMQYDIEEMIYNHKTKDLTKDFLDELFRLRTERKTIILGNYDKLLYKI